MITRKQYPNHHVYETEIGGRAFTVETGKVAELADAECICRYGDTVVLTTVTCNPIPKAGIDYFPLTIEFEERMYSVGRIPGSFNRREGKPSERGILNSRIIDRPMRPLFDEELRNDTVVTCTVLANDYDNPVEIVASLGASIAIACSDVPWNGPVATTNVAHLNGKYIINPSSDERDAADCFVCISSTFEKVVMIETEAREAPENIVYECIRVAHEANMEIVKFINSIVAEIGKPKFTFEKAAVNHELLDDLMAYGLDKIEYALDTPDKNVREERLTAARLDFQEKFGEKYEDFDTHIEVCLYKMQKKVVKKWLLQGKRVDGRGMDEIRPLDAEVGVLPRVHGSGLFSRGQTQVLSICTLNTLSAAQKIDTIYPEDTKRYIHHYNFPAYSTGEARAARSTSRREIGHGALAEKALLPVIPSVEEFPYAIRVVSEVLSSNGSTSQASICGSTLALMDAGVPIKRPVAGISCGLISDQETGEWRTFTDIQGVEDFHGEMDFKVAGTTEGITAIQMDLKNKGLTMEIIADEYGTVYFKNDSARLMAYGSAIERLEITQQPTKTAYAEGETFDPAGMVVTAVYANGKTRDVTDYVTYKTDPLDGGDGEFVISFPYVMYHNEENGTEMTSGVETMVPAVTLNLTVGDGLLGDVNGDGKVDQADAQMILDYEAKRLDTELSLKAADVSGDGVIDSSDAVLILQYAAGALKEFPAAAPKDTEDTGSTDQIAAGDTGLPKE